MTRRTKKDSGLVGPWSVKNVFIVLSLRPSQTMTAKSEFNLNSDNLPVLSTSGVRTTLCCAVIILEICVKGD